MQLPSKPTMIEKEKCERLTSVCAVFAVPVAPSSGTTRAVHQMHWTLDSSPMIIVTHRLENSVKYNKVKSFKSVLDNSKSSSRHFRAGNLGNYIRKSNKTFKMPIMNFAADRDCIWIHQRH